MEKKIVGYIPKLLFKIYLFLKEKFDPKPIITDEEKICVDICSKLIPRENSRLTYAPISKKRFIKNDDFNIFIVIDNQGINVINDIYSYYVYIQNDSTFTDIINVFDLELENRRQRLESEWLNKIQHSLLTIFNKIN